MKGKMAVLSIISLLAVTVSCGKSPTSNDSNSLIDSTNSTILQENSPIEIQLSYFIYNAAKKMLGINNDSKANLFGGPTVVYPFESVEVINPYAFKIETPLSIPQIASLTSAETIEVIVCDLVFDELYESESMIIFVGEYGIFSCLTNSWGLDHQDYNRETYGFSQHKKITAEGIMKYDPQPNLLIYVQLYAKELVSIRFYDEFATIVPNSYIIKIASEVFDLIP
jgi:hypothetical protein